MSLPILRSTHGDQHPVARAMAALRAVLARNSQQQEAYQRMAATPEAVAFDNAVELLIMTAYNREDVAEQRDTVRRLFWARVGADPNTVEGLDLVRRVAASQIGEVRRG